MGSGAWVDCGNEPNLILSDSGERIEGTRNVRVAMKKQRTSAVLYSVDFNRMNVSVGIVKGADLISTIEDFDVHLKVCVTSWMAFKSNQCTGAANGRSASSGLALFFERFFTRIANSKMNDNFKWMLYAENRRHRSQQMLVVMSFLVHLRKISNNKVNMDFFRGRNGLNCIINTYREIGF
jgi:hypothetical protein